MFYWKNSLFFYSFFFFFFFKAYIFDLFETKGSNKKLDIQKYSELKKRDAEWLAQIVNGVKYDTLAIDYNMSLGSVKNRLRVIFDELKVGDKQGFLNKYSDFEICYGEEFSSV